MPGQRDEHLQSVVYQTYQENGVCSLSISVMPSPQRRIDDRLRKLSVEALSGSDGDLRAVRREFLALLHQKIERLQRRAARLLLKSDHLEPERRSTDVVRFPKQNRKS